MQICFASLLLTVCQSAATGGGYGGSSGGGYGGGSSGSSGRGFGGGAASYGTGPTMTALPNNGPINAAVQSTHTVEIQTVPIPHNPVEPQLIEVDASSLPLTIHFKSASSNINVVQSHQPGQPGQMQQTQSEDEPHHLLHEVTKPIIQEVREVITPYRRVVQEVRPVQEEIQTIVARGEPRQQIQQQQQQFNGYSGAVAQSGYGSSGGYGGYGGPSGGVSVLGGSVSLLSYTSARTTGSPALSTFSGSGKKGKSDGSGPVTQQQTKDYAKAS